MGQSYKGKPNSNTIEVVRLLTILAVGCIEDHLELDDRKSTQGTKKPAFQGYSDDAKCGQKVFLMYTFKLLTRSFTWLTRNAGFFVSCIEL